MAHCFPTGALGYWARRLAAGGLLVVVTATSPARLAHPDGGPPLTGTNPLAIGIPSSDGVRSSATSPWDGHPRDVLAGLAQPDELVPFGGEQAHKAFALAVGLQLLVDSLVGEGFGAVLVVARPDADPVPALRDRAAGIGCRATGSTDGLAVDIRGTGQRAVLVHGSGHRDWTWEPPLPLAERWTLRAPVAVRLRREPAYGDPDFAVDARLLAELLRPHAHLAGFRMAASPRRWRPPPPRDRCAYSR